MGTGTESEYSRGFLILTAAGWGLASSVSLLLGCFIGIWRLPGPVTRGLLMAFGGGALLQAVSIELFGELLHNQEANTEAAVPAAWVGIGIGVFGGVLSYTISKLLNDRGGFLRHLGSVKGTMQLLRLANTKKLVNRLRAVPGFAQLPKATLERLSRSMVKETFRQGQPVIGVRSEEVGLYFILGGAFQVAVYPTEEGGGAKGTEAAEHFIVTKDGIFGDARPLVGHPLTITATALVPTRALFLPQAEIDHALSSHSAMLSTLETVVPSSLLRWIGVRRIAPRIELRSTKPSAPASTRALSIGARRNSTDGTKPVKPAGPGKLTRTPSTDSAASTEPKPLRTQPPTRVSRSPSSDSVASAEPKPKTPGNAREHAPRPVTRSPSTDSVSTGTYGCDNSEVSALSKEYPHIDEHTHAKLSSLGWLTQGEADALQREAAGGDSRDKRRNSFSIFGDTLKRSSSFSQSFFSTRRREAALEPHAAPAVPGRRDAAALAEAVEEAVEAGAKVEGVLSEELQAEVNEHAHSKTAGIIIWLGICLDGIPESLMLGIFANGIPNSYPSLVGFVAAVALANFPEAMSVSGTLKACGMKTSKIVAMWTTTFIGTGIGATVGSAAFPTDGDPYTLEIATAAIIGLCGGATIAVVASTIIPEAFELCGDACGFATLAGFIVAMSIKSIGISIAGHEEEPACGH